MGRPISEADDLPLETEAPAPPPAPARPGFLARHARKLWWLHSLYALGLGVSVVLFARKGFAHSRWLVASLGGSWLLLLIAFRVFGSGKEQKIEGRGAKVRFFVVTYALKNLYQGMLFFLIPFYWQSTSLDSDNRWFIILLALCALASTFDVVFDHLIMKWRSLASILYAITLFGCLNLVIPALSPSTRTLYTLLAAAGTSAAALWSFHVSRRAFRDLLSGLGAVLVLLALVAGFTAGAYELRHAIPPVPMYVQKAAVGPRTLDDGRLAMEVTTLHASLVDEMIAVTDVVVPGGEGDRLTHVWTQDGWLIGDGVVTERMPGPKNTIRLRSRLRPEEIPRVRTGSWTVDVRTEDGQLVGRARFQVIE
jgi:hypothetical protein